MATKILMILVIASICSAEASMRNPFLPKDQADNILSRVKRLNKGFLEETWDGNLERECMEETCTYEEAFEVFDNKEQADEVWRYLAQQCSYDHCFTNGTLSCEDGWRVYKCHCKPGYQGTYCEHDIDECEYGHCPAGTECVDGENSFTCVCPDEGCTPKAADGQQTSEDEQQQQQGG